MLHQPIIISGLRKSGTSMVRNLLDGHPDLFVHGRGDDLLQVRHSGERLPHLVGAQHARHSLLLPGPRDQVRALFLPGELMRLNVLASKQSALSRNAKRQGA